MLCFLWVLRGSMCMPRTCEKLHGGVKLAELYGVVRLFKWLGMLGWLELACPTACACL